MYDQVLMEKNTQLAQEQEKCQRQLRSANAELEKYKASPDNVSFYRKFIKVHR